jgi:alkylated DNA nucleotide flippase Atl1
VDDRPVSAVFERGRLFEADDRHTLSDMMAAPDQRRPRLATSPRASAIIERVRETPEGFVRTYGDISPGAPRVAGAVLAACEDESVPWHRIVRSDGSLAKGAEQRARLRAEGIPFRGQRVDMRRARLPEF